MRSGDKLSKSTIMRLPLYYRTINSLYESGEVKTSSDQLGLMVGIDPTQVRRDLSSIGEFGRAGVGYQIPDILTVLEKLLGFKSTTEAVLVGVGRLDQPCTGILGSQITGSRYLGCSIQTLKRSERRWMAFPLWTFQNWKP